MQLVQKQIMYLLSSYLIVNSNWLSLNNHNWHHIKEI